MRILHIIRTLNPESGGPATSVTTLNKFCTQSSMNEVLTLDDSRDIGTLLYEANQSSLTELRSSASAVE